MMEFNAASEAPEYKDVVDKVWGEIKARQGNDLIGIPFKFDRLNQYATIERGELFLFGAGAKEGKSMMLLNCAVDLLRRGLAVLYLDSELNTRMFTCRLIAHLAGIEFSRVKSGRYSDEEAARIDQSIAWLKTRKFTHLYMPIFDEHTIYTVTKKVKHTQGLDVLIVDYLKDASSKDAYDTYQELGRLTDLIKNKIAGQMDIAGLGAAQTTDTGRLAGSAKIVRNASTIAILQSKTPEEIEADGPRCGNKKLRVVYNRNGAQMVAPDEYIDLRFNGNLVSYEEAEAHAVVAPF